jgi:hypothetical protein
MSDIGSSTPKDYFFFSKKTNKQTDVGLGLKCINQVEDVEISKCLKYATLFLLAFEGLLEELSMLHLWQCFAFLSTDNLARRLMLELQISIISIVVIARNCFCTNLSNKWDSGVGRRTFHA